jgi:hypothetical protein
MTYTAGAPWTIFLNSHIGGWSPTGSTRHVGHLLAYCTYPGWLWGWRIWWNEDWQGKPKPSEKTCHFVHHKSHLTRPRARTRAAAVGSQRLTAWAMVRPFLEVLKMRPLQRSFTVGNRKKPPPASTGEGSVPMPYIASPRWRQEPVLCQYIDSAVSSGRMTWLGKNQKAQSMAWRNTSIFAWWDSETPPQTKKLSRPGSAEIRLYSLAAMPTLLVASLKLLLFSFRKKHLQT